ATGQIEIDLSLANEPPAEFDDVVRVAPGISPPTVLTRVEPQIPALAGANRIGGTVALQVVVQTDGTAKVVKVVRPLPFGLTEAAVDTIEQWKWAPATRDGNQIAVSTIIEVNFGYKERGGSTYPECPAR